MPYQKQQNLLKSPPNADSDNNKDLLPFPLAPLGERVGVDLVK